MKAVIYSLMLIFIMQWESQSQQPIIVWQKSYHLKDILVCSAVQQTSDGGYIVTGSTGTYSDGKTEADIFLLKTDANGDTLWTKLYGQQGIYEEGWSVQQTKDGGYFITGIINFFPSSSQSNVDGYVIKTDSIGNILWTKTFGGLNQDHIEYGIQTSDGGYAITGYYDSTIAILNYQKYSWLIKLDANGNSVWSKMYGSKFEYGHCLQQTEDGGFVILGDTYISIGSSNVWLIKTNANGDSVWTRTYTNNVEYGNNVKQTFDGGYIISVLADQSDMKLIKTDSNGEIVWENTYGGTGFDHSSWVLQTPETGYISIGTTSSFGAGGYDLWIVRTNSDGDSLWSMTCGGSEYDGGTSISPTSDGGYIILGETRSFGNGTDVYLIKLSQDLSNFGNIGFRPKPHGWSIKNAKSNLWDRNSDFPDRELFASVFGWDDFYYREPIFHQLVWPKEKGYNYWRSIKKEWKGSCFGFAISSMLFYEGHLNVKTEFDSTDLYSVPLVSKSRKMINKYFFYQFDKKHSLFIDNNMYSVTPNQTFIECNNMLSNSAADHRILAMYNCSGTGGHAVVPYKCEVDTNNPNTFKIYVYDSNKPNDTTLVVLINSISNTWFYSEKLAWGGKDRFFLMDSTSTYVNSPEIPKANFRKNKPLSQSGETIDNYVEFFVSGAQTSSFRSSEGELIYDGDKISSTVRRGHPIIPLDGAETPPIGYFLSNSEWESVFGEFTDSLRINLFTPTNAFIYSRYNIGTSNPDHINYCGDNRSIQIFNPYEDSRIYNFEGICVYPDSEVCYLINNIKLDYSDTTLYSINYGDFRKNSIQNNNRFKIENHGSEKLYDLTVKILSSKARDLFEFENIPLPANTIHLINPDWRENNNHITIFVDEGMDGVINDTLRFENLTLIDEENYTPEQYKLLQNYPNPFNSGTAISWQLPKHTKVTLKIYDILGNEIETLVNEKRPAGTYELIWDARNLASGVYFYRLQTGDFVETKKMILLR